MKRFQVKVKKIGDNMSLSCGMFFMFIEKTNDPLLIRDYCKTMRRFVIDHSRGHINGPARVVTKRQKKYIKWLKKEKQKTNL